MCRRFDLICFLPLYGEAAQFSWLRRMKIAIGIAQGLRYLYTESQPPFAISDLNSNSVYVIEDSTPKVLAWLFCTNWTLKSTSDNCSWLDRNHSYEQADDVVYWSPTGDATGELQPVRGCGDADPRRQPTQGNGQRADAGFIICLRQVTKVIHLSSFSSDPFYCDIAFKSINFYDSFSVKENGMYLNKLRV